MTEIPQEKVDWLSQLSQINGIPLEDLKKYYMRFLNDETYKAAFTKEEELLDYADMLITTHIQEFHSAVLTEYEVMVVVSSTPKTSKNGSLYNNHVMLAKLPGDGQKVKWMNVVNLEDTGKVEKLGVLTTGTIKVNVAEETEQTINAFSRGNTEYVEKALTWLPADVRGRRDYLLKIVKNVEIAKAKDNLSAKTKDEKGYQPWSLRVIRGNISMHRIIKKTDEKTGAERVTGIINIVDKSVATNPDFFKQKTVQDPKDPSKTQTIYGGFSAFVDPEDIKDKGKGTEAYFIGRITAANQMNVDTILPILVIAPKKATEKLQKPGTSTAPATPDASVSPAAL